MNLEDYTYKKAIEEIENIIEEMENGDIDPDEMIKNVEKAALLIAYCREKLKKSETTLKEIMQKMELEQNEIDTGNENIDKFSDEDESSGIF